MKIIRRILALALCALTVVALSAPAFAATNVQTISQYGVFAGVIKTVNPVDANGNQMVFVESADGQQANVILTPSTIRLTDKSPSVGASITAIYDATLPMIMIYPPQYSALAVAIGMDGKSIKIDRFDKNMLSSDGSLKINVSANTIVISADGKPYTGSLADKTLLIVYDIVLESYPMQTGPEKIVVLSATAGTPAANPGDVSKKPVVVNGVTVKVSKPYLAKNGTVMVPLSPIAKALGSKVVYFGSSTSTVSFRVGKDSYKVSWQKEPIVLGTPSARRWGIIYVPLNFFTEVLRAKVAKVTDTQIVIESANYGC